MSYCISFGLASLRSGVVLDRLVLHYFTLDRRHLSSPHQVTVPLNSRQYASRFRLVRGRFGANRRILLREFVT